MGVPKFFRWLSERYPKINQRYGSLPDPETTTRHFPERSSPPAPFEEPDPMATCGLAPPIDRLYLDMNGIIHGCSHNNNEDENNAINSGSIGSSSSSSSSSGISNNRHNERDTDASVEAGTNNNNNNNNSTKDISREEIFRNVCYYLDRVIGDMVQPEQLVYMAIDGVAPRAKMNQQRSRRYRSGGEGEIETTIYEAHRVAKDEKERREDEYFSREQQLDEQEQQLQHRQQHQNQHQHQQHKYDGSYSFVLDADEGNAMHSSNEENILRSREHSQTPGSKQSHQQPNEGDLQEVSRGRFKGKFEARAGGASTSSSSSSLSSISKSEPSLPSSSYDNTDSDSAAPKPFHSNEITPGTPFFAEFTQHLEHFVKHKLSTDPKWKKLTIVFSGPNVPGEGEHKIMQFLREQRDTPDYDPNLRHCIMGQDGDLMMLGLLTHEPNMVLLREKVVFNMSSARLEKAHAAEAARRDEESNATEGSSGNNSRNNAPKLSSSLDTYIYNPHFEFLHLQVLRDYLAYEFETSNVLGSSPWDLERTIDDFVFLTFLIGNDFLPHLPALDIADQAFDLLYHTYKRCRLEWLEENGDNDPYLTHAGNLVSGRRLEKFFAAVGSHEVTYYEKKKQTKDAEHRRLRKQYKKLNMKDTLPDESIVASKEEADRAAYRAMLQQMEASGDETLVASTPFGASAKASASASAGLQSDRDERDEKGFVPVTTRKVEFQPAEDHLEEGLISRMGTLLQNSLSSNNNNNSSSGSGSGTFAGDRRKDMTNDGDDDDEYHLGDIDDQDLKGRYYYDKFEFTPFDADKHRALRKAYMEGLVWNLKYYYEGCVSWNWFYPYHYGPMLSDLVELDEILDEINFEDNPGAPLDPFDQLMGCMPPSQAHHLPEAYRPLMTDPESPIIDFYPNSFVVDMNGKRWPWEAVTLLPFIDSQRLIEASGSIDRSTLSRDELDRNATGNAVVMRHDPHHATAESVPGIGRSAIFREIESCSVVALPFEETDLQYAPSQSQQLQTQSQHHHKPPVFLPEIKAGTRFPLPGFATLRDAPVETLYRRRLGINVHGGKSRYKTASLEISSLMPPLPPLELLAPKLVGTTVFINYPYFVEALVTAVSDETMTVRGKTDPRKWTPEEANRWKLQRDGVVRRAEVGEGYCGTGGLIVPEDQPITLSVRPFQGFATTPSGQTVKKFAVFEVETPLIATFWAPSAPDPRLIGVPSRLEKNAYEIAMSKKGNDPLLGGLSGKKKYGGKRRKLFPLKPPSKPNVNATAAANSNSNSKRNSSLNRGGRGRSKMGAANYSSSSTSLHLGMRRGDKGGNPHRRGYSSWSLTSSSAAVPLYTTIPQHLGLWRSLVSSVPKTSSSGLFPPQLLPKQSRSHTSPFFHASQPPRRPVNIVKTATTGVQRLGSRGRIVAAGLAVAACFWNPANATQYTYNSHPNYVPKIYHTVSHPQKNTGLRDALEPWSLPRGGDTEQSSSIDAFLPPQMSTPSLEFAHGTTTLSFAFQGGIICAVDSRASMGQFVGSKTTQKVLPVGSHILGTMAGGAADCQHWIRKLKAEALLHELTEDGRRMSVARASRVLSNYMYALRGFDLSVGTMIMGYDDDLASDSESSSASASTPYIYYVDNTGLRIQGDMFAVGSGSTFALGILDSEKDRYNLDADKAVALGIKAIRHATFRDAYSGGYINVFLITPKDGWKKVYTEDIARTLKVWKALKEEKTDAHEYPS